MAGEETHTQKRKPAGKDLEAEMEGPVTGVIVARQVRRDHERDDAEESDGNEDVTAFPDS